MKYILMFLVFQYSMVFAQKPANSSFIKRADIAFLEEMTKDVLNESRIYPGQFISTEFGSNNTQGTLIRPGGRNAYPSFWIRDYAMALETGLVSEQEQRHMLTITALTQCDQAWITKGGSLIPVGSVADHIRIDNGLPIYFPGTYSYEDQGVEEWGTLPPYCDQFFFIHMAYYYAKYIRDPKFLLKQINGIKLIDRLKMSFNVPPSDKKTHIVYANDLFRGVDFGFRDAVKITGQLSIASILKFRAANELAEMFLMLNDSGEAEKYKQIALTIKQVLPDLFIDHRGMIRASTGKSNQADVWATALAVYFGMLEGEYLKNACHMLAKAYISGNLSYKGNIRHILSSDDFSEQSAWEFTGVAKDVYQNGAYWGTPTGWVCYAISKVDVKAAADLAAEFINDLRENDYRKGSDFGAPYECFNKSGYRQNPIYLTTVACPLIVFKSMVK